MQENCILKCSKGSKVGQKYVKKRPRIGGNIVKIAALVVTLIKSPMQIYNRLNQTSMQADPSCQPVALEEHVFLKSNNRDLVCLCFAHVWGTTSFPASLGL